MRTFREAALIRIHVHYRKPISSFHQRGGGYGEITIQGHAYQYETVVGNNYTIQIKGPNQNLCMLVLLEEETAILQILDGKAPCSMSYDAPSSELVLAAYHLAKMKGASRIELTDYSKKTTPSGREFSLANMYFLTEGKTWYESILPFYPVDSYVASASDIEIARTRALTNSWASLLSCDSSLSHPTIDSSDIDIYAPGSARQVLQRIKQEKSDYFVEHMSKLLRCSAIPISTLDGTRFQCDILSAYRGGRPRNRLKSQRQTKRAATRQQNQAYVLSIQKNNATT